jgi:spermidine/putrescine transport system substrate-binding protein
MTDSQLTRLELLRRSVLGGAALTIPGLLAACGGSGGIEGAGTTTAAATTATSEKLAKTLTISNWPYYIDIVKKRHPTLDQFKAKYGVTVKYIEDVNDNDSYFGKVQAPLRQGQSIGRDIMVLTDWMAARMVRLGWLSPLDDAAIPNKANLEDGLAHPSWDPDRTYSLPWQSFLTGIGYDPDKVGKEITTFDDLLDPKLKGKVTMLSEMIDTLGLIMLSEGDDPNKVTKATFDKAMTKLKKAISSGQIRQFTGNDYGPLLAKGDVWAAVAWSGDIIGLQPDNPNLKFSFPEEGGMIATDNMLIPKGGDVFTASTFMNYVYDPKVMAKIEASVNYVPPVKGTKAAIAKIDPALAKNPLIFPDMSKLHAFDPRAADNKTYKQQFQTAIGA